MYQCSLEFTSLEVPGFEKSAANYEFEWECLVDAKIDLVAAEKPQEDGHIEGNTVRCIFSRVYIDDSDLFYDMENETEVVTDSTASQIVTETTDSNSNHQIHTIANTNTNTTTAQQSADNDSTTEYSTCGSDSSLYQTGQSNSNSKVDDGNGEDGEGAETPIGSQQLLEPPDLVKNPIPGNNGEEGQQQKELPAINAEELRQQRKEKNAAFKRRKRCSDFASKIGCYGFSNKFALDNDKAGIEDDGNSSSHLHDVKFEYYTDSFWKKMKEKEHKVKQKRASRSASSSPPTTQKSGSGSSQPSASMSNEEKPEEESEEEKHRGEALWHGREPMSEEEKLHFDFGFDPKRDKRLIAQNAREFFGKDQEIRKYWNQRMRFFTRLNKGILLDREGWFSVTPELMARHVADRLVRIQDCTILDAFTGPGGNAIQFALRGAFVFAIDIDPVKIRCAAQNARVYGVSHRINFICGDFFQIARSMFGARDAKERKGVVSSSSSDPYPFCIDAVYLSPPWGGPQYKKSKSCEFDLRTDINLGGRTGFDIFHTAKRISPNIVYFLPRNTSTQQLIQLAAPDGKVELEQSCLNTKVKALHAYYGRLVSDE